MFFRRIFSFQSQKIDYVNLRFMEKIFYINVGKIMYKIYSFILLFVCMKYFYFYYQNYVSFYNYDIKKIRERVDNMTYIVMISSYNGFF